MTQSHRRPAGIVAVDAEPLAAPCQYDIVGGFDLVQVFVQRTTQIGQTLVVDRLKPQGQPLPCVVRIIFFA